MWLQRFSHLVRGIWYEGDNICTELCCIKLWHTAKCKIDGLCALPKRISERNTTEQKNKAHYFGIKTRWKNFTILFKNTYWILSSFHYLISSKYSYSGWNRDNIWDNRGPLHSIRTLIMLSEVWQFFFASSHHSILKWPYTEQLKTLTL